jgi:hypothetical protein
MRDDSPFVWMGFPEQEVDMSPADIGTHRAGHRKTKRLFPAAACCYSTLAIRCSGSGDDLACDSAATPRFEVSN